MNNDEKGVDYRYGSLNPGCKNPLSLMRERYKIDGVRP